VKSQEASETITQIGAAHTDLTIAYAKKKYFYMHPSIKGAGGGIEMHRNQNARREQERLRFREEARGKLHRKSQWGSKKGHSG
jgi:hypothetical protein